MQTRYSLRFESGDRKGETVPIGPGTLTIGRKLGNTLVVPDPSVSGSHARIELDGSGLVVKDLGSTNGTRIGTRRISESRLQPGEPLYIGNVKFEVLATVEFEARGAAQPMRQGDTGAFEPEELQLEELQLDAPAQVQTPPRRAEPSRPAEVAPYPTAPQAAPRALEGREEDVEASHQVSAATLARSKKSSKAPLLAVLGLLALGMGLWFGLGRDKDNPVARNRPVEPLQGNLLPEIWSFEGDEELRGAEEAPESWLRSPRARRTGNYGLLAEASAEEWALARTSAVEAREGQLLAASAAVRSRGGAVRLGLELLRSRPDGETIPGGVLAWSAPLVAEDWSETTVVVRVPPGHVRARVLLLVEGGSADADDVGLVLAPGSAQAVREVTLGETRAVLDGDCSLHLEEVDRVMFSGLRFLAARESRAPLAFAQAGGPQAAGGELALAPGEGAAICRLRVENALLAAGGIATIVKDGTQRHSGDFARDGVETLLLGGGNDLVRFRLASAARVEGRPEGDGMELVATFSGASGVSIASEFGMERKAAGDLAHAARNAAKAGDSGKAIAAWSRLLDEAPYDAALVEEGGRARSGLVEAGMSELRALRARAEQARFFDLADMHAREQRGALDLARRYEGSEVAEQAIALADELGAARSKLLAERAANQRRRLEAVRDALRAAGAKGLAAKVDAALAGRAPGG
ncbi:MAG: hypothetical protein RL112_2997 [Planctomycetota bacterium]